MKILVLSYLEPIDCSIISLLDPKELEVIKPVDLGFSIRNVYSHWFQNKILNNKPCDRGPHHESQTVENDLMASAATADILITCDAPILSKAFVEQFPLPIINIHFGITRFYRGLDTIFWPLFFEDFDNIGLTFHHIDAGVDTGKVVLEYYPALEPGDTELKLWQKMITGAQQLLPEVIAAVRADHHIGVIPDHKGRLFQKKERSIYKELTFRWREKKLSVPVRQKKTVWF